MTAHRGEPRGARARIELYQRTGKRSTGAWRGEGRRSKGEAVGGHLSHPEDWLLANRILRRVRIEPVSGVSFALRIFFLLGGFASPSSSSQMFANGWMVSARRPMRERIRLRRDDRVLLVMERSFLLAAAGYLVCLTDMHARVCVCAGSLKKRMVNFTSGFYVFSD